MNTSNWFLRKLINKNYLIVMSKNKKTLQKKCTTTTNQLESIDCGPVTLDKSGKIAIKFLAKPGAKQNSITDISNECIGIQISAPPVEGEANTELIKYLSKVFNIRKSDIILDRGSKSRHKTILISKDVLTLEKIMDILKTESAS